MCDFESGNVGFFPDDTEYFFKALFHTIETLRIPVSEFRKLLKAFRQDSVNERYRTFSELIEYSDNSANPVGHLVLYTFGYNKKNDEAVFDLSDKICTALQLTNFWQDVKRDSEINRIYIPEELLRKYDYSFEDLQSGKENDNFRNMMKNLTDRTEKLFEEGTGITRYAKGRLKYELKATIFGGKEILNKIRKINYNVLSYRPVINNMDKMKIIIRNLWK